MSPRERKTREQRAAENDAVLRRIEQSRAEQRTTVGGEAGWLAREVVEDTLLGIGLVVVFLVPTVVGWAVADIPGAVAGGVVGAVVVGVLWVLLAVTGAREAWRQRRTRR